MEMNVINWFEIPVENYERAVKFYSHILNVEITRNQMGPVTYGFFPWKVEAHGATGALAYGDGNKPSETGSRVCFSAGKDMLPILNRIEESGGVITMPKTSIGEHGFIAHFKDSEGNLVMLHAEA